MNASGACRLLKLNLPRSTSRCVRNLKMRNARLSSGSSHMLTFKSRASSFMRRTKSSASRSKNSAANWKRPRCLLPTVFFYDYCILTHFKVVIAQHSSISSQMKEELFQAQQISDEREAANKQLEVQYAEALQRIASMERAQRTMEEEMRSVKMAARQSLPAATDAVEITSLKDKIIRLENELQHLKSSTPAAPPHTTNKRVSLDSLSADELKSNYETLCIRNDLVQEELQRVQAVCDRLQDELVRLRSDAAADRDACSNMQLSLANERAASDALERSLHALQSELSGVYSKLQDQECNGSSLQRMEQEMKKMQQQAGAAADQLRAKEFALLEVQRKLADEHAR